MAAMNGQIVFTTCEGRPCWVDGRRAIFHRRTDSARPAKARKKIEDEEQQELPLQIHNVHALVEYEDGTMEREWPNKVRFADSAEKFAQFDWDTMEACLGVLPDTYDEEAAEITEAQEPDSQEETQPTADIYPECETCAHGSENEDFCKLAGYDCQACTVRGCYCKRCREFDRWEAKEGAV